MTFTLQDLQPILSTLFAFLAVIIGAVALIIRAQANAFAKRSAADTAAYTKQVEADSDLRKLEAEKERLYLQLVNDLRGEVTGLKAQTSKQDDLYRREVERGNRLEDDMRQLRDCIGTLERQVVELTNERDDLKQDLSQTRDELATEKRLRKEAEAAKAQEERERERERKELNAKVENLEGEIDTLRKAIKQGTAVVQEEDAHGT